MKNWGQKRLTMREDVLSKTPSIWCGVSSLWLNDFQLFPITRVIILVFICGHGIMISNIPFDSQKCYSLNSKLYGHSIYTCREISNLPKGVRGGDVAKFCSYMMLQNLDFKILNCGASPQWQMAFLTFTHLDITYQNLRFLRTVLGISWISNFHFQALHQGWYICG